VTLKPEQEQLIRLYRSQGNMAAACEISGTPRHMHDTWRDWCIEYRVQHNNATNWLIDEEKRKNHKGE
jgi:hypothetical protein